jgi:hypothetical protein
MHYDHLNRMSQLNVLMDGAAKAYLAGQTPHPPTKDQQQKCIAGESWSLWISGKKIARDLKSTIYQHIHDRTKAKKWWIRKERFTENTIDMINWTSTGRAMKSSKLNRRQWITKHTSGICGVDTMTESGNNDEPLN